MSDSYWNSEDDDKIICPYCGHKYEPSYEDCIIGDKIANCYKEGDTQIFTCDYCRKKFTMQPYLSGWSYLTETIDGEMTEDEYERLDL